MIESQRPRGYTSSEFLVEVVHTREGVEQLREEYRDLLDASGNALPFFLHRWHVSWCRHFLNHDPRIKDDLWFHVVRTLDGLCVAIVPLVSSRRKFGPFGILSVNFLGADPAFTEIRGSIIRPGYEELTAEAVLSSVSTLPVWDWIHWTGIRDAFWQSLQRRTALQPGPSVPFYLLDLPATWEEFRAGLKRNIRESIRHCYNSLKREGHTFSTEVITEEQDVAEALRRFLILHRKRAVVRGTVDHADRFTSASSQEFLRAICEGMAADGMLRIFQLRIGEEVVAMRIGFLVRDSLYLYYSGFDPKWSRFSVMTTTVVEAIKYAIAQGLATVNLSPGVDVSKTRWGGREVYYESAVQHGTRLQSRMAHSAYRHAASGQGLSAQLLKRFIAARRRWE